MAIADINLFDFYREALVVVLVIYGTLVSIHVLSGWLAALNDQRNPYARHLRSYVQVQVLRLRVRPFAWDLLQICGLTAILIALLVLH